MAPRSSVIQKRPVTDALITMIAEATARPCGDHEAPPDGKLAEGYTYVNSIDGGVFDGPPFWSPESEGSMIYQITSVGLDRNHVEWIADRVRLTMVSRTPAGFFQVPFPAMDGLAVVHRAPTGFDSGVVPEGPPTSRVYNSAERYRLGVVST